jgi:hypothetical protein
MEAGRMPGVRVTSAIVIALFVIAFCVGACDDTQAGRKKPLPELHRLVLADRAEALQARLGGAHALTGKIDILARDERQWTALHHAAVAGHAGMAKALLDFARRRDLARGSDIFAKDPPPTLHAQLLEARTRSGATALLLATPVSAAVVDVLLAHGADPNATDTDGTAPLHVALPAERVNVVQALLDRGADPRMRTVDGVSAQELCPQSPLEAMLHEALQKNPQARDVVAVRRRWKAFLDAVQAGKLDVARAYGVDALRERMRADFPRWKTARVEAVHSRGATAQALALVTYAGSEYTFELDATWMRAGKSWSLVEVRRKPHLPEPKEREAVK